MAALGSERSRPSATRPADDLDRDGVTPTMALASSRPGFRVHQSKQGRQAVIDAHQQYETKLVNVPRQCWHRQNARSKHLA
jgi:hypothetical protein